MPSIEPAAAPTLHEGLELRETEDKGRGVFATRTFRTGETVMVGVIREVLPGNTIHAMQIAEDTFILADGLMPHANHSCDPACGIRVNAAGAHDLVALRTVEAGDEVTFDYAMENDVVEHAPPTCACGTALCRGRITGWRGLPADRRRAYEGFVAPYLYALDRARGAAG